MNVRKAMAPHSRLLIRKFWSTSCFVGPRIWLRFPYSGIDGTVLPPTTRDPNANTSSFGLHVTPDPLLPNLGNRAYQQDMAMWFIHNAKERTLEESIALGWVVRLASSCLTCIVSDEDTLQIFGRPAVGESIRSFRHCGARIQDHIRMMGEAQKLYTSYTQALQPESPVANPA
jgi:hypothetical protein